MRISSCGRLSDMILRIFLDILLDFSFSGLYPCGEGAGYAGGITSSALDGILVAAAAATR